MNIKITKMQGCGNDFVFLSYEEYRKTGLSFSDLAKRLCDRHFGIGGDGIIVPIPYSGVDADIEWQYYNSDGTSAQMCGNGMRCFSRYVYDNKLVDKKSFRVKTLAGIIKPEILDNGLIRVNMGKPILDDEKIPFDGDRVLTIENKVFNIVPVSMGNPHCVIYTKEDTYDLAKTYGPLIEKHKYFPQKTNVEFVKVISKNEVEMCVYERGCGITLACGTGACATVVAGVLNNLTENNVRVNLLGGAVNVDWTGSAEDCKKDVYLTGPAKYVFTAEIML